jgi:hypothetical protein
MGPAQSLMLCWFILVTSGRVAGSPTARGGKVHIVLAATAPAVAGGHRQLCKERLTVAKLAAATHRDDMSERRRKHILTCYPGFRMSRSSLGWVGS